MMNEVAAMKILLVDDDENHRFMLETIFSGWGYQTKEAENGLKALEILAKESFNLVLMDIRMDGLDGLETQKRLNESQPNLPVIMMTAYSDVNSAVQALKNGAYDYLNKPLDFELLKKAVDRALEHTSLKVEKELGQLSRPSEYILGYNQGLKKVMEMVEMVAPSEATVLITGESGTGKELIARAIYEKSRYSHKPLAIINCAALSENLLEAELFGHEKGAFTGADKKRDGRLKAADGGTVFLDEIAEMPLAIQAKILRTLQEGEIQRLGSDDLLKVKIRFIAATNRDVMKEVKKGNFREDLYYRLNVFNIHLPPLRERVSDLSLLAAYFVKNFAEKNHKIVKGLSPKALELMLNYDWPGNVRELQNVIERAVILVSGEEITSKELPLSMKTESGFDNQFLGKECDFNLEEVEKKVVRGALLETQGNRTKASELLGVTRKTLAAKIKKYFPDEEI